MKNKIRILVVSDEVWNDKIHCNNVLSNWFAGMDAEFANIYLSPGQPDNNCCSRYYQITDTMMIKSIFGKKAGRALSLSDSSEDMKIRDEKENIKLYSFLKTITNSFFRLIRECIWLTGRYDTSGLSGFVDDFKPDIIFTERYATCKILRLERIIHGLSDAPIVAFTGDDEYSLHQLSFSPFFWINRLSVRKYLRRNVKFYSLYYTLSEEQKDYYEHTFKCNCKVLQKCGNRAPLTVHTPHNPIRMVYAGKMYCNRWRVLAEIAGLIKKTNEDGTKIVLDIYTRDRLKKKQKLILNDGINSNVHPPVSARELLQVYANADIAIHVESRDLKNRLLTRYSFSTKIIDCIFSGCAVFAYCWKNHSGYTYLKNNDIAICASDEDEADEKLKMLSLNPQMVTEYSEKALRYANNFHVKENVQNSILNDFANLIEGK